MEKQIEVTVYQRNSDNKWVASANLTGTKYANPSKKRDRKVVYGKTKKEATMKINKFIFELENGIIEIQNEMSLIDFLNMYMKRNEAKWEPSTIELYKIYIRVHFEPYFSSKSVTALSPTDIEDFYQYKREELSGNTILKLHKFLNSAMNWGVKKDVISKNICKKVDAPSLKKYVPNIYDEEKFLSLWQSCQETYDKVYIALGAGCGLRRGEIMGLTWENIDFDNNTVSIVKTRVRITTNIEKGPKNETSERRISAPQYVMDSLKWWKEKKHVTDDSQYVLTITPQYLSQRFRYLLDTHCLEHIRLHDLRHYNATIMLKEGVPDVVAAGRLGHASTATLKDIYQHVLRSMDQNASDKLEISNQKK